MSDVKYRLQQTNKKTRDRAIVAAFFLNERSPIKGALNLVLDRPAGGGERPTRLVIDTEENFYDVLPPMEKKPGAGGATSGTQRRDAGNGDDSL